MLKNNAKRKKKLSVSKKRTKKKPVEKKALPVLPEAKKIPPEIKTILSGLKEGLYYKITNYNIKELVNLDNVDIDGSKVKVGEREYNTNFLINRAGKSSENKLMGKSVRYTNDDDDDDDDDDEDYDCDCEEEGCNECFPRTVVDKTKKSSHYVYNFRGFSWDSRDVWLIKSIEETIGPIELQLNCGEKIFLNNDCVIRRGKRDVMDKEKSFKLFQALGRVFEYDVEA